MNFAYSRGVVELFASSSSSSLFFFFVVLSLYYLLTLFVIVKLRSKPIVNAFRIRCCYSPSREGVKRLELRVFLKYIWPRNSNKRNSTKIWKRRTRISLRNYANTVLSFIQSYKKIAYLFTVQKEILHRNEIPVVHL